MSAKQIDFSVCGYILMKHMSVLMDVCAANPVKAKLKDLRCQSTGRWWCWSTVRHDSAQLHQAVPLYRGFLLSNFFYLHSQTTVFPRVIFVAHKRVFVSRLFQLAEYRQRKAQSDGQKKQKKKKKKPEADAEERMREEQGRNEGEEQRGDQTTVFSVSKTLHSGETVTHDQTYTIEVSRVYDP